MSTGASARLPDLSLKGRPWSNGANGNYRTVAEARIIDILLLAGCIFELEAGRRKRAVTRTEQALEAWVNLGLQFQRSIRGERLFDPVEVVNFMKWAGLNGLDRFWTDHFVATARRLLEEWDGNPRSEHNGQARAPAASSRFEVSLRRRFDLRGFRQGTRVRLRLPLPLSGWAEAIDVAPVVPAASRSSVTHTDGRLDVQLEASGDPIVDISANLSFMTSGRARERSPDGLDPMAKEVYLRPSEGLIRVSPRIATLSQTLVGDEKDNWKVATGLWRYLIEELNCGMIHYDQVNPDLPGDWVLDAGWYDCQLGSALFVSMCRARGIPARIMSGFMLYRVAPGFHYWSEVWIQDKGWTPFDLLTWDLSEAGRSATWQHYFVGTIDYRMVTQCMPLAFTGPMSVRFPPAWHLITTPTPSGMETTFEAVDGQLIYSDHVAVHRKPEPCDCSTEI